MLTYIIFILLFFILVSFLFLYVPKIDSDQKKLDVLNYSFLIYFIIFFSVRLMNSNPNDVIDLIFAIIPFIFYNYIIARSDHSFIDKRRKYYIIIVNLVAFCFLLILPYLKINLPSADINGYSQSWVADIYDYLIFSKRASVTGLLMLLGYLSYIVAIVYDNKPSQGYSMLLIVAIPIYIIISTFYDVEVSEFIKGSVLNSILYSEIFCLIIFVCFQTMYYYVFAVALISLSKPIQLLKNRS